MNTYKIYWLSDPRTSEMRYIGQTTHKLEYRLKSHCKTPQKEKTHKTWWIRQLRKIGLKPKIHLLQILPDKTSLNLAEIYWIAHFKMLGCDLTNIAPGGEGRHGPFSDETKRKMSDAHKGKTLSDETKLKMSLAKQNMSDETKRKISIAHFGKKGKFSDEHRARMSIAKKGKKRRPFSNETRAKMSIIRKAYWIAKKLNNKEK